MTSVSRTAQFAHVHKVLRKHYRQVSPPSDRPVLEHLLFACCLEDAHYDAAEESFAALVHTFYDWNEVRVSSIAELCEVLGALPDPRAAAGRVKRSLQSAFEATYSFDLEDYRKKNLGPTIKWLEKLDGTTPFVVAYVVQAALGGHAIPVDSGSLRALRICELISDKDLAAATVPGLERAVSKSKGIEFASLLHQLGADLTLNPYSPAVRGLLLEIHPEAGPNLPRRRAPRKPTRSPRRRAAEAADGSAEEEARKGAKKGAKKEAKRGKPAKRGEKPAPKASKKQAAPGGKKAKKETRTAKGSGRKKKADPPASGRKRSETQAKRPRAKKSATQKLSKRKPR